MESRVEFFYIVHTQMFEATSVVSAWGSFLADARATTVARFGDLLLSVPDIRFQTTQLPAKQVQMMEIYIYKISLSLSLYDI